jgi:hypothetical protein
MEKRGLRSSIGVIRLTSIESVTIEAADPTAPGRTG